MEVTVSIGRAVVINDDIDPFDIYTTTENICRYKDTLLEGLESSITFDTMFKIVRGSRQEMTRNIGVEINDWLTVPPVADLNEY